MSVARDHVFISYARRDGREYAEKVEEGLRSNGFDVWLDKRGIDPDKDFTAQIEDAIEAATHLIVCVTPDSKRKDSFVRREIQYALLCKPAKPILPLLFADIPPHIHINTHTWIDFFKQEWKIAFGELLNLLKRPSIAERITYRSADDPYREHLETLIHHVIGELRVRVMDMFGVNNLLQPPTSDRPEEVQMRPVPLAYQSRRPHWLTSGAGQNRPRTFNSFPEAFEWHRQRVLLLGEPGAGKTTTLLALALQTAYARLDDHLHTPVPIYAPAYTWSDANEPFVDWLARVTNLRSEALQELINQGQILLLIDGLDELAFEIGIEETPTKPYDYCVEFMRALGGLRPVPTLVTCRIKDYEQIVARGGEKIALNGAVSLEALTEEQIGHYLEEQRDLLAAVRADKNLLEMVRTPLLLSLLAVAYRDAGSEAAALRNLKQSPEQLRQRIFEMYLRRRYEFEAARAGDRRLLFSLDEIEEYLSQAAFLAIPTALQADNAELSESEIEFSVFGKLMEKPYSAFSDLIIRLHIVRPVDKKRFRFIHMLMRDYFAEQMLRRLKAKEETSWEALIKYYASDLFKDIRASLRKRSMDSSLSEDIEQQTWATAVLKIGNFEFSGSGRMYYWLRMIAYHHVREMYRREKSYEIDLDDSLVETVDRIVAERWQSDQEEALAEQVDRAMLSIALTKALENLSERDRDIAVRRIINRESVEDIALRHGLRVQTVYQITARARQLIRRYLGGDFWGNSPQPIS